MGWKSADDKIQDIKFLVDLEKHTYISDKSHQEIINQSGLNPAGYDNYLKGWVKTDGTIKLWVETLEDLVFRYWDQIKMAFRVLLKQHLTNKSAKTYAIVNRIERFAGMVRDFVDIQSRNTFYEDKLGYTIQFFGQPRMPKGSEVILLVNYKLEGNRYIFAGTRGKILSVANGQTKRLRIKWDASHSGYMQPRGRVELYTDRRLLSLV